VVRRRYRPERTLSAYRLAIDMGADYIEADLITSAAGMREVVRYADGVGPDKNRSCRETRRTGSPRRRHVRVR